jgi:hypothetical protein
MTHFLGLGVTHYPLLAGTDEHMAGLLRWTLQDPGIPVAEKDPASWPEAMRAEWSTDGGTAAASQHRKVLRDNLGRCRDALDEFQPDLVVVWGDDQYENFREEVVPPFCVLAYGDLEVPAFEVMNERGSPNAWGLPDDMTITLHGDAEASRGLADELIRDGFDMAYSYKKRPGAHFPHAILNTQLFLDYDHAGAEFPYPLVPITVNCYGQHAIARRGGLARFSEIEREQLDPVGWARRRSVAWISVPQLFERWQGPVNASHSLRHRVGRTRSSATDSGTSALTRRPISGSTLHSSMTTSTRGAV